ncbi:MAG: type II toxin-antitoxin system VapC family toxin [Spirochaetaceae bacterium]|nr:type II toxin-antitoxin system VapC family toxin [Spirochaetaceae bacterium]
MKTIYLLDTNIISEVTKPVPSETVITNLEMYTMNSVISSVTWFELINGVNQLDEGKKKKNLQSFLLDSVKPSFKIIPYDENAAFINASINQKLLQKGRPAPILDTQIASIAISNNLILVTKNIKDFQIIKEECNLMLEEW